jgi:hypothetical protein
VVSVAVAGDLLPINTATRLQSVLRQTHRVVLNEANQWRASVEIAVDVLAQVPTARMLGATRHFVEVRMCVCVCVIFVGVSKSLLRDFLLLDGSHPTPGSGAFGC